VSSWFLNTGNDIIDSEEHASRLNSGIERLEFDGAWIPNRGGVHVFYLSGVSVNSHVETLFILMEGSKLGKHSNDVSTTVLGESSWDNLKSRSHGLVWPLMDTFDSHSKFAKSDGKFHLKSSSTWNKLWVLENVSGNTEGIVEVSLDLVKDIFGGTSKDDGASFWVLAIGHVGEVIVTEFLDLEFSAVGTDIFLLELFWSVANGSTTDSGDSVVIGLSDSSNASNVTFF